MRGAFAGKLRHGEIIAGGGKIGIIVRGEHGDGEQAQVRSGTGVGGGMHGLRIAVNGEKRRPQPHYAFNPARNGMTDVVELKIEKDALSGAGQHARKIDTPGESERVADFVERDRLPEPRDKRLRLGHRGHISATMRRSPRLKLHGSCILMFSCAASSRDHKLGGLDQLAHHQLELPGGTHIPEVVHVVEGLCGVGHANLLRDDQRPATHRQHLTQGQ